VVSDRNETEYGNLQLGLLSDHRINGLGDLVRDGAAKQAVSDRKPPEHTRNLHGEETGSLVRLEGFVSFENLLEAFVFGVAKQA
jgi:hypothetical protein